MLKGRQISGWIVGISLLCGVSMRGQEARQRVGARVVGEESQTVTAAAAPARSTQTAAPRLVKFGGVLIEPLSPVNGPVEMTLALYKDEIGGEPVWSEIQTVEIDKEGRYTVLIGATQAEGLPAELFPSGEARWLGVEVRGEAQEPRVLLVGVPYALKAADAEKLGGKPASDFVSSASLTDQVRQVIEGQSGVTAQATSAGVLQPGQTKANSTLTPQATTAAGPMFPPSSFSGTNSTQIVRVQQNGSGNGLYAQTASTTGNSAVVGVATSNSTAHNQNGVIGFNAGAGSGVAGIATNPSAGVGVYGQSAQFAGVFGQTFNPNTNGVAGTANAATGFSVGVSGTSASANGAGVFGNAIATSGFANGVQGQTSSPGGVGVFGIDAGGQSTGVYGQTVNGVGVGGAVTGTSGSPAYGVWGDSASTSGAGVAGYEDATSGFVNGVFGQSVSPDGNGVFGVNLSSGGIGVRGVANAAAGNNRGVVGESSSPDGDGIVGVNHAANGGTAVNGFAAGTTGNAYGVFGNTLTTGFGAGAFGVASAATGNGFGVFGEANSPNGNAMFGHAASATGFPTAMVGFLDSTQGGVAGQFVAHGGSGLILQGLSGPNFNQVFSLDANGNLHISGNLIVDGTKSSTAQVQNGRQVALYAVESPENWFEDFGSGQLNSGVVWVSLDASFGEATNAAAGYHVFLTAAGESNGLYVSRKTAAGFEVREQGGGSANIGFDYRVVAKRRGYEAIRMAEVQTDTKTVDASRQHLAQFVSSGMPKKAAPIKALRNVQAPAIQPIKPRPSTPQPPRPNIPGVPPTR
jgi:hypothetical protein